MIDIRNAAQWTDLPFEVVAALTPTESDELTDAINGMDPWAVQDRKPAR